LLAALAAREARRGATDARAAYRRAFRTAALRWHPDKFEARFAAALRRGSGGSGAAGGSDTMAAEVSARVRAVAQALNDAWARVQGDAQ
jgi:curved DNA-binding protein CbpA